MTAPATTADSVLGALGDPTRREVLARVARHGPTTATELADALPISRQAVSKHLAVLADAGLVRVTRAGREARVELVPGGTEPARAWLDDVGRAWDDRLDRLRRHLGESSTR